MPDITAKNLLPLPLGAGTDAALRNVPAPPRFRGGKETTPADAPVFALPEGRPRLGTRPPLSPAEAEKSGEAKADAAKDRALREAVQQFEAFFVSYLMKQMRKTVNENGGLFAPSQGEKLFRDMMDDETARAASTTDQMGLAELMYKQLVLEHKNQEGNNQP